MIVATSALLATLLHEKQADQFRELIIGSDDCNMSAVLSVAARS
jgi:uncharacterized protein with PIN domain